MFLKFFSKIENNNENTYAPSISKCWIEEIS